MISSPGVALRAGGRQLTRVLGASRPAERNPCAPGVREASGTSSDPARRAVTSAVQDAKTMYPLLEKLGLLNAPNVRIKDKARVEELMTSIVDSGFSKLQVIADFDRTLSRVSYNGKLCETCHGILDNSSIMPPFYRQESNKLLAKYYPIEIDHRMTEEEKVPHMMEWYDQIHNLIIKCQVSKGSLEEMVSSSNVRLRDGTEELFGKLDVSNVPVLVFSAGMGDILEQVLRHFKIYTDNVKVVSNFFKYDEKDVMVGFQGDLIHMFNKNENAVHSSDYFDKLAGRNNIILMGDSLGDTKMAVGVSEPSNILKIGFLNEKVEERLETYMENFDVVLLDDQTMHVASTIVDRMK